ncbi:MAG: thiamine pyrophosphate-dependent dehydrogenase E1 component subunit alpha [Caldilineaceae bacterium]|nr:thiamine pyrophosphate-dependent dehydrogenase E1 component subunit alpha [Caldilineaceae bacterium]
MTSLSAGERLDIYRWMYRTRRFDEVMVSMFKQGRGVGTCFSARGHEAVSIGAGWGLQPEDFAAPMHRNVGMFMLRGLPPDQLYSNYLGRANGTTRGRDANLHGNGDLSRNLIGFISHIPQSLPVALGTAMSFRYRRQPQAALTVCGDGGSTAGVFHETLNMAVLYKAPLVVVLENNQYAYSTPVAEHTAVSELHLKARAYDMPSQVVDGNDVLEVFEAVSAALARARADKGPFLVEARTMRMLGHAIHDGAEYVPDELLAHWEAKDPVVRFRRWLQDNDGVRPDALQELERAESELIDQAFAAAEASPFPDPDTVEAGVYAD